VLIIDSNEDSDDDDDDDDDDNSIIYYFVFVTGKQLPKSIKKYFKKYQHSMSVLAG